MAKLEALATLAAIAVGGLIFLKAWPAIEGFLGGAGSAGGAVWEGFQELTKPIQLPLETFEPVQEVRQIPWEQQIAPIEEYHKALGPSVPGEKGYWAGGIVTPEELIEWKEQPELPIPPAWQQPPAIDLPGLAKLFPADESTPLPSDLEPEPEWVRPAEWAAPLLPIQMREPQPVSYMGSAGQPVSFQVGGQPVATPTPSSQAFNFLFPGLLGKV